MSLTDQAISLLNGDPDVVPGARSLLAEELIKGSYEDGAAPMPQRLAALKADPKHAFMFAATTQGGAGVGFVNGDPPPGPAPGSVEAVALQWAARNGGGFGLKPVGQTPTDISRRPAPAPPPAPEPRRPSGDQQALGAEMAAHLRGVVERGSGGFGLRAIK